MIACADSTAYLGMVKQSKFVPLRSLLGSSTMICEIIVSSSSGETHNASLVDIVAFATQITTGLEAVTYVKFEFHEQFATSKQENK